MTEENVTAGGRIFAVISFFVLIYITLFAQSSFAGSNAMTAFEPFKIPDFRIPFYHAIAQDTEGFVYLAGLTSSDFGVTPNAYDTTYNGGNYDIFIAKLAPQTLRIVALTLLGGENDDWCSAIIIKPNGTVVLTGSTTSPDFLLNNNSKNTQPVSGKTIFVAQLDKNLQQLSALNLFGPGEGLALAESNDNILYVAGRAHGPSDVLKASESGWGSTYNGGRFDAFVAKLDDNLMLSAKTFIGGNGRDVAVTIATDKTGNVIVAGYTDSKDFPFVNKTIDDKQRTGRGDGFIARFTPDLKTLYETFQLGGSDHDVIHDLALAADESIYVAGLTESPDFPATSGSYDESYNGKADIFVSHISVSLDEVIASTYVGGSKRDRCYSLVIDKDQNIYAAGDSESIDFTGPPAPTKEGKGKEGESDIIVIKLNRTLTNVEETFLVGGKLNELVPAMTLGQDNNIILAGLTNSIDFLQEIPAGDWQGEEKFSLFLTTINDTAVTD